MQEECDQKQDCVFKLQDGGVCVCVCVGGASYCLCKRAKQARQEVEARKMRWN